MRESRKEKPVQTACPIIGRPSPNFDDRREGLRPAYIILHYTDMATAEAALERLCDLESGVSAHYLVDEDGAVYRMVDEDRRARHAGESRFDGVGDFNSRSIGIEIANPGHSGGYRPFPPSQMRSVRDLCFAVMARHAIPAANVLAHSDIAPARKRDPGEWFPWKDLAENGVGLWPAPDDGDRRAARAIEGDAPALLRALEASGYDPAVDPALTVAAFQRHFHPEVFAGGKAGVASEETAARLLCLGRLRKSVAAAGGFVP